MNSIQNYGNLSFQAAKVNPSKITKKLETLNNNERVLSKKMQELREKIEEVKLEILREELLMFDSFQNGFPCLTGRYDKLLRKLHFIREDYNDLKQLAK